MLPVQEYHDYLRRKKKAYQNYECASPYGNRAVLRNFKKVVHACIDAWNNKPFARIHAIQLPV